MLERLMFLQDLITIRRTQQKTITFVMSPKADLFLVGALFGDSSACLFEFSLDFLLSDAIAFELVVFPLPALLSYKMNKIKTRIKAV